MRADQVVSSYSLEVSGPGGATRAFSLAELKALLAEAQGGQDLPARRRVEHELVAEAMEYANWMQVRTWAIEKK